MMHGVAETSFDLPALTRSLDRWLADHLAFFYPRSDDDETRLFHKLKAFDELCLYVLLSESLENGERLPEEVDSFVASVCADSRYIATAVSSPKQLLLYIFPLIYIARHLSNADVARQYAVSVLGSDLFWSTEKNPHRMLDALFGLWMLDPSNPRLNLVDTAWNLSNGVHPPHAGWNDVTDFYSFTHNLFFKERLGLNGRPLSRSTLIANQTDDLVGQCIDFGILRFLSESNLDVALELVLSQVLANLPGSMCGVFAMSHMVDSIQRSGYVAGPNLGKEEDRYSGDERVWFANYHTSLVSSMLLRIMASTNALTLRPGDLSSRLVGARVKDLLAIGSCLSHLASGELEHRKAHQAISEVIIDEQVRVELVAYLAQLPNFV